MAKGDGPVPMPFWADDWLSSPTIMLMSPAEEGALIRLCAICWLDKNCELPSDDEELRVLSRLTKRQWARGKVRATLVPREDVETKLLTPNQNRSQNTAIKLTHPKVWKCRKEIDDRRANQVKSGKVGAERRWGTHDSANATPMANVCPPSPSPSPSPSPLTTQGCDLFSNRSESPTPAQELARWWMGELPYYRSHPADIDAHLERWADAMEKLTRLDKHPWEEVERLVRWVVADHEDGGGGRNWKGWAAVIRTPMKLRQKQPSSSIRYYDVLLEKMADTKPRGVDLRPLTNPEDYDGKQDINPRGPIEYDGQDINPRGSIDG